MKAIFSVRRISTGTILGRACLCLSALAASSAAFAQIEVLEVMYNATDDTAWEWIEVRNTGGAAIDLNGYLGFNLGDADITAPNPTIDSGIDPDTTVNPGEIAVIYDGFYGTANPNNFVDQKFRDAWGLGAGVKLIGAQFFPALSNTVGAQGQSIGFWASDAAWKLDQTPVETAPGSGIFVNRTTSFANAAFSLDYSGATFPTVDGVSSITWTGNGSNQTGTNWVQSVSGSNGAVTSIPVTFPGSVNNANDVGNPGIAPPGTPATTGLHITEIMYDPASSEADPRWEWVEIYNSTGAAIDLSGYVLDDFNATAHASANIAAGSIAAGGTAILYNSILTGADFAAAWGAGLNLVAVTDWTVAAMSLNNSPSTTAPFRQESVALWSSFASYTGDNVTQANAIAKLEYNEGAAYPPASGFPSLANGPSISLADLSFVAADGASWDNSIVGDAIGSFNATALNGTLTLHPGGDVGSPGSFTVVTGTAGDFDGDGDVDGRDFLAWQRGESPNGTPGGPVSAADLATWQGAYNGGALAASVAVPEPTSLVILALALVPLAGGRKR